MMNRTRVLLVLGLLIAVLAIGLALAHQAQAANLAAAITLPARWSYTTNFVCGLMQAATTAPPAEPAVKPGNYATMISLHNPGAVPVTLWKKVVIAAPEIYPNTTPIPPTKRFVDRLKPDHGMYIDCTEIVNLLNQNGTPLPANQTFVQGLVVIDAATYTASGANSVPAPLDVFATFTTAVPGAAGTASTVNSIEVVPVAGRSLPAGTWPF